jgi:amino acid transporter
VSPTGAREALEIQNARQDAGAVSYEQELSRSISPLGNVFITLSSVTPASSVFIIIPAILATAGTGSFLAMVFAAVIGVFMAFCWAELAAAYPIAAGDYALVWHAFKGPLTSLGSPLSFALFVLELVTGVLIVAVIALGIATYLSVIHIFNPAIAGAVVTLLATTIATLNIRTNAVVTGIFLTLEMLALLALIVLGLTHLHARFDAFFAHWVLGNGHGALIPVSFATILTATAVAVFAYNGYNVPVFFSEETRGPSRGIAVAILWSLVITVAAEIIPTTAVLLGAPDIAKVTASATPMNDFILATSGKALNTLVSLGVALAIFNAVIAIILTNARIMYASSRDRAYPGILSRWMGAIHPTFCSPWFATILQGIVAAILCLAVPLNTLINLTGASLVFSYALIAIAALAGRATGATAHSRYKMWLWPMPPILALLALGYVASQQPRNLLAITGIELLIGLVWWALVVLPQRGKAWTLKQPILDIQEHVKQS